MKLMLASNLQSSCLSIPSAGITSVHHYVQLLTPDLDHVLQKNHEDRSYSKF
jgi:hypothetical protein